MTKLYYRILKYHKELELFKKEPSTDTIEGSTSFYFFSNSPHARFNQLDDLGVIEDVDGIRPSFNGFASLLDYMIHTIPSLKLDGKPLTWYL